MTGNASPYGHASLFGRLREAAAADWQAYVGHPFVGALADGTLPEAAFRHYLIQDYRFLVHFARAWGLAVYKADGLADMRAAQRQLAAILDHEMGLHVDFCAEWGLDEAALEAAEEDTATLAYTRYVLERGAAGDLLDLHVAMAPCIVGYAEIGSRIVHAQETPLEDNPYRAWIEMYADEEYQAVARDEVAALDRLAEAAGIGGLGGTSDSGRFAVLARTFAEASRLEAAFWQMGLDAAA